jgi:hypothetical protein
VPKAGPDVKGSHSSLKVKQRYFPDDLKQIDKPKIKEDGVLRYVEAENSFSRKHAG